MADDVQNPPELGVLEQEIKRVGRGSILMIPASAQTSGHGTTGSARFYRQAIEDLTRDTPRR